MKISSDRMQNSKKLALFSKHAPIFFHVFSLIVLDEHRPNKELFMYFKRKNTLNGFPSIVDSAISSANGRNGLRRVCEPIYNSRIRK